MSKQSSKKKKPATNQRSARQYFQYIHTSKWSAGVLIGLLLVGILFGLSFVITPDIHTRRQAIAEMHENIAHEASFMKSSMLHVNSAKELKESLDYNHPTFFSTYGAVIVNSNTLYSERVAGSTGTLGTDAPFSFYYHEYSAYGCYRLTADLQKKDVLIVSKDCSDEQRRQAAKSDPNPHEFDVNERRVQKIRDSYYDNLQCLPGGNAYYSDCAGKSK